MEATPPHDSLCIRLDYESLNESKADLKDTAGLVIAARLSEDLRVLAGSGHSNHTNTLSPDSTITY